MPTTKEELLDYLRDLGIEAATVTHPPLFTVEESKSLRGELPGAHCKNLFLKDAKGKLFLLVCREDLAVDLKVLPEVIGAKRLSFGSPERLMQWLGVTPGSVTPFAAINDKTGDVQILLDNAMMAHDLLNYHPLTNEATTAITPQDLLKFLAATGHEPKMIEVPVRM